MTRNDHRRFVGVTALCLVLATTLMAVFAPSCPAQSFESLLCSLGGVKSVEKLLGPILPECGIGATFRSELGTSFVMSSVDGAKLVGSQTGELDLRTVSMLDTSPYRYDYYANFRLWRFGLKGTYSHFNTRSHRQNFAKFDNSGLSMQLSADLVQHNWMALGGAIDFSFIEPAFIGGYDSDTQVKLDLRGDKGTAVGGYFRYVPPEILNIPVHAEAYFKVPFKGSKIRAYGGSLVFRPQIYRFDLAFKLSYERSHLKFNTDPSVQFTPVLGAVPTQEWQVDMEWRFYGIELCAYF